MARIILIAHPVRGRLYPLLAIGQSLKERGHRVTVIEYPELSGIAEKLGLEYLSPALPQSWSKFDSPNPSSPFHKIVPKLIKRLQGTALDPQVHSLLEYLRTFESYYDPWTGRDLDFLQPALEEANCDLLLVSDTSFAVKTLAEKLNLPMLSISSGIPLLTRRDYPPEFTDWEDTHTKASRLQNRAAHWIKKRIERPTLERINHRRRNWNMSPHADLSETLSDAGYLSQWPPGFDFPLRACSTPVHYTGPTLSTAGRERISFPWSELTGDPVVYVSAGTVSDPQSYFEAIAAGCAELPVQLVITQGGGDHPARGSLPGDPLIVPFAPQLEVLKKSTMVITHASVNTALEALACGLPSICLPQRLDQFGTAIRLKRAGVALVLNQKNQTPQKIKEAVTQMLLTPGYSHAAKRYTQTRESKTSMQRTIGIVESTIKEKAHFQNG